MVFVCNRLKIVITLVRIVVRALASKETLFVMKMVCLNNQTEFKVIICPPVIITARRFPPPKLTIHFR